MIGTIIEKKDFNQELYSKCAEYCNKTQLAIIEDRGDFYEVVKKDKSGEDLDIEVNRCKRYLSETDWIYFKCQEEGLDVNVKYAEVIEKRKKARARINEIESITGVTYGNFK